MISVNGEEYLTVKEATRLLGVKPATLYAYVSRGVLRSYRQGIKRQRLYRRAEAALTLSEMTGGRFMLGIGVSHRASMEAMLGLSLREPLAVMREYVAVLRGAVGGTAAFDGRHYRVNWSLAVSERPPAPSIYLAALSRNMLELAGEIGDGVVLWLCSPGYVRDVAVPALERGRRRAGKTLAGFEIVAEVPLAISDDAPGALAAFRTELARYLTLPFYRAMLEASRLGQELAAFDRNGEGAEGLTRAVGAVGKPEAGRAFVPAHRDG